jgi:hypothetical protein
MALLSIVDSFLERFGRTDGLHPPLFLLRRASPENFVRHFELMGFQAKTKWRNPGVWQLQGGPGSRKFHSRINKENPSSC